MTVRLFLLCTSIAVAAMTQEVADATEVEVKPSCDVEDITHDGAEVSLLQTAFQHVRDSGKELGKDWAAHLFELPPGGGNATYNADGSFVSNNPVDQFGDLMTEEEISNLPPYTGLKVIGAGLSRTGTVSFCLALGILGYRCDHGRGMQGNSTNMEQLALGDLNHTIMEQLFESHYIEATADTPWNQHYETYLQIWPEAKVVLTLYPGEAMGGGAAGWADSLNRYANAAFANPVPYNLAFMDFDANPTLCTNGCCTPWDGTMSEQQIESCIVSYNAWNAEVKATVPADQLLVFSDADGWEPLCSFLGHPIPTVPFPDANHID